MILYIESRLYILRENINDNIIFFVNIINKLKIFYCNFFYILIILLLIAIFNSRNTIT